MGIPQSMHSAVPSRFGTSTLGVRKVDITGTAIRSVLTSLLQQPPSTSTSTIPSPCSFQLRPYSKAPSPPSSPSLTAPLPSIANLTLPSIQHPSHDPVLKLGWCRDVLFLVDRLQKVTATDIPAGPITISDPQLLRLSQTAVPLVLQISAPQPPPQGPPLPTSQRPSTSEPPLPQVASIQTAFDRTPDPHSRTLKQLRAQATQLHGSGSAETTRTLKTFLTQRIASNAASNKVSSLAYTYVHPYKLLLHINTTTAHGHGTPHGPARPPRQPRTRRPPPPPRCHLASTHVPQPTYVYGLLGEFQVISPSSGSFCRKVASCSIIRLND